MSLNSSDEEDDMTLNSSDYKDINSTSLSDDNLTAGNDSSNLENNTISTSIYVEKIDAYALTNITINANVSNLQTDDLINEGSVVFKINGITVGIAKVYDGMANITYDLSGLSAKNYTIYAKYTGSTKFTSSNTTSRLKIVKRPIMMSVSNRLVYSYTNVTLTATIVDKLMNSYLSEGIVLFKINGITIGTADIINGKANLTYDVSSLSPKNYTISAIYAGSKLSYDKQATNTLRIIKRASSMTASQKTISYGQNVTLVATVADKVDHTYVSDGLVVFKINGITIGTSNITNGKSYLYYNTSSLSSKTYNISTTYSGTKFLSENWANTTLIIQALPVDISMPSKLIEDYHNLSIKIMDNNTQPVSSGHITVTVDDKITVDNTLSQGYVNIPYNTLNLSQGKHQIKIIYKNNNNYENKTITTNITVYPQPIITLNPITTQPKKINITAYITNSYLNNTSIEFRINNTTIAQSEISNSKASITYDTGLIYNGNYTLEAFYIEDDKNTGFNTSTNMEVQIQDEFTYAQIKNASVNLRNMYESNHIINKITVASSNIEVQDFLALLLQSTLNINKQKSSLNISYKHYNSPDTYNDTINNGSLTKKELISLASEILNYMNNTTIAPEYINTTLGNLGYYNIIYTYSKILDLSTTNYISDTITVYNWQYIHPKNSTERKIYISTDNIYTKTKDLEFVNKIIAKLESCGYEAYSIGVGPNTHNAKIWSKSLPDNAVELAIFGGADAGVIRDVCTRSFMRAKANRLIYFAYNPSTSTDITNCTWLERAHDDNYSPTSFKGISNPDKTLLTHGYDYVYSYDVDTIVSGLIDYIS